LKIIQVFDPMAEEKLSFAEVASISIPPLFSGVNFQFRKIWEQES